MGEEWQEDEVNQKQLPKDMEPGPVGHTLKEVDSPGGEARGSG